MQLDVPVRGSRDLHALWYGRLSVGARRIWPDRHSRSMTHFGIVVGSDGCYWGSWSTVGYCEVLDGTVLKELGETNMSWMSLKWFACRSSLCTHSTTKAKF